MDPWVQAAAAEIAGRAERELGALVGVSSPSGDAAGAEEVLAIVRALLPDAAVVERPPCSSPGHAADLLARVRGTGSGRVLLLGHVDTVVAHGEHRPLTPDGDRLAGSGAIDMKGGDVLALGVLRALAASPADHAEVALLLVCDEEWRTAPFRHAEHFAGFDACLCFEAGQTTAEGEDEVVVRRKAAATLLVSAAGRSAHSGSAPERGANAAVAVARAALAVADENDPGGPDRLTAVPTVLRSGDAFNVVPAAGELTCDLRADDEAAFDRGARRAARRGRGRPPGAQDAARLARDGRPRGDRARPGRRRGAPRPPAARRGARRRQRREPSRLGRPGDDRRPRAARWRGPRPRRVRLTRLDRAACAGGARRRPRRPRGRLTPPRLGASRSVADAMGTDVERSPVRRSLLPLLIVVGLCAPAGAWATEVGINVPGGAAAGASAGAAGATGARYARVFWDYPGTATPGAELASYAEVVSAFRAAGLQPVITLTGRNAASLDPAAYAAYIGTAAAAFGGRVAAWEVWNEPDEAEYWGVAGGDPAKYTALLKAVYPRVSHHARVLVGGLVGNDYDFVDRLYAAGAQGSFDAIATHTDTACSLVSPYDFYRDPNGRISRYSFLGFREVRASMERNGDGGKPIWITELGWNTMSTEPGSCDIGVSAGKKAAGVSQADQATFTGQAYHCLAEYPYVSHALLFTLRDEPGHGSGGFYGILTATGAAKTAYAVFSNIARSGPDAHAGDACGDFVPPTITTRIPANAQFSGALPLRASATDRSGVARISYYVDTSPTPIRNFTPATRSTCRRPSRRTWRPTAAGRAPSCWRRARTPSGSSRSTGRATARPRPSRWSRSIRGRSGRRPPGPRRSSPAGARAAPSPSRCRARA